MSPMVRGSDPGSAVECK